MQSTFAIKKSFSYTSEVALNLKLQMMIQCDVNIFPMDEVHNQHGSISIFYMMNFEIFNTWHLEKNWMKNIFFIEILISTIHYDYSI
jgi:hypothetical protein